ncbi:TetR/AcrR family transcriptional regulator [Fannyhessea vaginae]|uniref:TetR/AcrR family transcriptional regulator n=1 Tax=Actinomycetota TaxID=201174 RepID=UPI000E2FE85B|nr:TetR/AcrR family transcriptional regulator [Gardnerella swidsinskii]NSX39491.1 TetR/AcrR family transcriptional regulator [Gardnerella vaginalis]
MTRNKRLSFDERKQAIKHAAIRIFVEQGFENTTMEDLVKETGLSKGGFYHYYKNTTDILHDIMLDGIAYRNTIMMKSIEDGKQWSIDLLADEMARKVVDSNALMPVYVELLLAKKRNPQLEQLYRQLEHTAFDTFRAHNIDAETLSVKPSNFELMAFFVNAIILSASVLNEHKLVQDNQALIKQLLLNILKQGNAHTLDEDNSYGAQPNNEGNSHGTARTSDEGSNQFGSMQGSVPASSTSLPGKERS